jgi:hypothetical protein
MTAQPDRPAILPRRTRPQPAADEARDPVQPQEPAPVASAAPAAATSVAPVARGSRRRQAAVQLSVRIPEDLADQVADEAIARGIPQRQLVEDSLRSYLART